MILSEDGCYFFDLWYHYSYTKELQSKIIKELFGESFNTDFKSSYSIIFTFINDTNCRKVASLLNGVI